jgi:hypothetical protein
MLLNKRRDEGSNIEKIISKQKIEDLKRIDSQRKKAD